MSNFIKVDVSSLSSYQNDFNNEHNYFNNKTYTTFTSGYLKSCGDQYINQMASHLKSYYERVEIGYRNINTWWAGYVNDVEALEKLLSGEGNAAGIEEPAVISAIAKLFNIDTYENTLDGTFGEQGGDYGSAFSFDDQSAIDMANANVFGENDTSTSQNFNILNATGATVLTAVGGAAEGFLSKGENVVDAALIAGTATLTSSAPVALIDLIQKGYSKISGKEVEPLSDKIWDSTKAFVAKDHVKTMFNDFYENNSYGQWIKNNAIGFDVVRNFSAGIGGMTFNFTVSALTGGTIPPSAVAAVTDFGAGTAQAWAEGASTEAGMVYGMGHAAIGYITYASGEKTKLIKNPFVRAGVDGGINTAGEGIDEILKIATYKKGYTNKEGEYVEFTDDDNIFDRVGRVYEESGGYKNVVTQFALGAARSYVGEKITDGVGKFTNKVGKWWNKFRSKNAKPDIEVLDAKPAIDDSKPELPPNQTIIDTEGKTVGFDYETLDGDKIDDFPSGIGTFDDNIKGLPAGADDVGLTAKNPKNLVSPATEGLPNTTALNAFDDVEMPTQTPGGTNSGVEVFNMEDAKPLAASSDALGDTSALKAFDEVEMPKAKTQGLPGGTNILDMGETKPLAMASNALGKTSTLKSFDETAKNMYREPVIYTPSKDSNSQDYLKNLFEETADEDFGIGNDQGRYKRLYHYIDENGKSIKPGSQEYQQAIKNGKKLNVEEMTYDVLGTYEMLQKKYNMSYEDAVRTVELIDVDAGVCSYAATLDNIVSMYVDRQQEFYDKTGIPLFIKGQSKSGAVMNTSELLADLYVTANLDTNGGKYFTLTPEGKVTFTDAITVDNFGNAFRTSDTTQQVFLSSSNGMNVSSINAYLESNGFTDKFNAAHYQNWGWTRDAQTGTVSGVYRDINQQLQTINNMCTGIANGKQYELGIYRTEKAIRFLNLNNGEVLTTTHAWNEGAGHATKVIGNNSNGFIVSTWGKELVIPFGDLLESMWCSDEVSLN